MLDETLPPGGDTESAAPGPAHETTESVTPAAADEPAAPAAEAAAEPTAQDAEQPPEEEAAQAAHGAPAEAAGDTAAAAGTAQDGATPPAAPAPVPEMSPAACAALLAEHFPGLFAAGRALPIKLRVQVDIQARAPGVFTRKAMSLFLHRYTTSTAYLKALVASPHRFDLDGAPAGEVAAEHREAAQAELLRRQAIVQEKRSAQRRMDRPARPGPGPRAGAQVGPQFGQDTAAPGGAQPGEQTAAAPLPHQGDRPRGPGSQNRPRPPQPQRPRRDDRRPPSQARPGAPAMPRQGRAEGPPREPRPPMPARRDAADAGQQPRAEHHQPRQPSLPPAELEARRERAALLRAYESSTLTKANFCVLKRVSEADLDNALTQARQERGETMPRSGR